MRPPAAQRAHAVSSSAARSPASSPRATSRSGRPSSRRRRSSRSPTSSEVWVTAALYDQDVRGRAPGPAGDGARAGTRRRRLQGPRDPGRPAGRREDADAAGPRGRAQPARPANGLALRPGMFATVALETSREAGRRWSSPSAAIQTLDGQPVVFVETPLSEGAAYQRRPVKVGRPRRRRGRGRGGPRGRRARRRRQRLPAQERVRALEDQPRPCALSGIAAMKTPARLRPRPAAARPGADRRC